MARPTGPMTAKIESFIRMEARGESADDILREIFKLDPETCDPAETNKAYQQMWRWRHREDAQAIWDDEVRSVVRHCIPRAVHRLKSQVDNQNDWVANKASNDVINLAKTTGIFQDNEKAISVKIEGLPDIGSPDDDV